MMRRIFGTTLPLALLLAFWSPGVGLAQGFFDILTGGGEPRARVREKFHSGQALAQKKIALLSLNGVIFSRAGLPGSSVLGPVERLKVQLRYAAEDPDLLAVVLEIDSPGGGITASDILHREVSRVRDAGKKVVALLGDVAASGGYYVAAAADRIVAHPTTLTGSIGVILQSVNVEELYSKIGLKDRTFKSSATPHKDMLSSTREITEEERAILVGIIDAMYDRFVEVVMKGRKMTREQVAPHADGRVFLAAKALEAGLVDQIGFEDDALELAASLAEAGDEYKVVEYKKTFSLEDFLGGSLSMGAAMDRFLPPWWQAGGARLLYLWKP